ncbi:hypothetical protein LTS18_006957 [Coniosporium uncinatum]|uniref:Uncharacterized protein n=1 Tax=Coniosporium uncinatum TaxID=93489 RepID=A0ACC3D360_9PEZI|nr:hypothetical protein LTS18_006957 [Coniosporium uncinatum]
MLTLLPTAVTTKKGQLSDLVNLTIPDDTASATLTLWNHAASSTTTWRASHTVLLLSNPGWRFDQRRTAISLTANTYVDVDPSIPDAEWLRGFAARLTRREHVCPEFPQGAFDVQTCLSAPSRVLFTLADLDELARAAPRETFMGFLSVVILEMNLVLSWRRNMLMCNECCGVPLFANKATEKCKQCDRMVELRINPKVLGQVVDETGSTAAGKMVWSQEASEQLLGRTADELVGSSGETLRYLEQRLLFLRVTLVFGWKAEEGENGVGRLCVGAVRM